jgi:hypothetical protein
MVVYRHNGCSDIFDDSTILLNLCVL